MNTYKKYCPNVFVAKCPEQHQRGDVITLTTRRGKENEHIVHNLVYQDSESFYYSITREDGHDIRERAKKKAEKYKEWAESREKKSDHYFEAAQEGHEFLSLGEPIKVGHQSERRHRNLIERNHRRMEKRMENKDKAEEHKLKSEYWESKKNDINLSMPESLEFYKHQLEKAKSHHKYLKENPEKRLHGFSLAYANKDVKKFEKLLDTANRLWAEE